MKKFADTVRRLLSIALNLFIVWAEPIALPMSWDWGKEQMFIFYTEDSNILSACICAMVAVGQLVCIFTGRELPHWLHTLKYIATCCLTMTFLTVVFVLGPMYEDGNGWYIMLCTSSMLYHHLLNPLAAIFSFVLLERTPRLPRSTVKWALLPTVLYGGIILWLNIQRVVDGPYPFMKVYDQVLAKDGRVEFKTDNQDLFTYSLEAIPEAGWNIEAFTRDLHHSDMAEGNVMTEYETKFSAMGNPICKLIASR